jgi:outer membrane receptor protein involved in Fe transport
MKYKSGYRQLEVVESSRFWYYGDIDPETGEPEVITAAAYEEVKLGETFTADIVVSWEQKIYSSHKITATLEVTNLFNNKNRVGRGIVSYGGTVIDKYELGRQFWAGLAYEF